MLAQAAGSLSAGVGDGNTGQAEEARHAREAARHNEWYITCVMVETCDVP